MLDPLQGYYYVNGVLDGERDDLLHQKPVYLSCYCFALSS